MMVPLQRLADRIVDPVWLCRLQLALICFNPLKPGSAGCARVPLEYFRERYVEDLGDTERRLQ
jgi:hypothetical protein